MKHQRLSFDQVCALTQEILRQVHNSGWYPDYVVGITRGGALPAVLISQYLGVPMKPLMINLRDHQDSVSDLGMAEDAFGYVPCPEDVHQRPSDLPTSDTQQRKNILVVDDINDTGNTFNWLMNDWMSGCLPHDAAWDTVWNNNVRFAVLVDNLSSKCSRGMDYFGQEINKSNEEVWIDFPWENWWRT